jgi:hypothetical protein
MNKSLSAPVFNRLSAMGSLLINFMKEDMPTFSLSVRYAGERQDEAIAPEPNPGR